MNTKETIEEAAERYVREVSDGYADADFIAGAKLQQERMYSEEEVYELLFKLGTLIQNHQIYTPNQLKQWFEQHKKIITMKHKLNNTVIKVLNKEHGAKVIQWWKEQGVETSGYIGNSPRHYYGLISNEFLCCSKTIIKNYNCNIIELPEELPKDWYIKVTEENIEILDKWRLSVATQYKSKFLRIGYYVLSKHMNDDSFFYENTNIEHDYNYSHYKEIDLPTFLKITSMQKEKPKEENRVITAVQAQDIIDSACSTWKKRLANIWGGRMVLDENIEITQDLYQEMRNACNPQQHLLFDTIFGKDVEHIPYGTPCLVRDNPLSLYKLAYSNGKGKYICSTKDSGSHWSKVIPLTSLDVIPKLK